MPVFQSGIITVYTDNYCGAYAFGVDSIPGGQSVRITYPFTGEQYVWNENGWGQGGGGPAGAWASISAVVYSGLNGSGSVLASGSVQFQVGSFAPYRPEQPGLLTATVVQSTGVVSLSWGASASGGQSPNGYALYRNGVFLKNVAGLGTQDNPPRGTHTYTVAAYASNACGSSYSATSNAATVTYNSPPSAPILTSPPVGGAIDRTVAQRLAWIPSDSDAGDTQSKFDLQYRIVSAPAWTTVGDATPNPYFEVTPGTFAEANYEWQVRTYDALGYVGPWSPSSFFTAGVSPGGPTILGPTNGAVFGLSAQDLTWSAAEQESFQVQKLADISGTADETAPLFDSGEVVSAETRTYSLGFPVNNQFEHLRVRVRVDGLWSPWASVRIRVSYTPPPVALVRLTPDNGSMEPPYRSPSITVQSLVPPPLTGEPAATYIDVFRSADNGPVERVATGLPPSAVYLDRTVAGGVEYAYMVRTFAANGTFGDSLLTVDPYNPTVPNPTPDPDENTGPGGYNGGYTGGYGAGTGTGGTGPVVGGYNGGYGSGYSTGPGGVTVDSYSFGSFDDGY